MNQNEEINYRKISDEIRRYFAGNGISIADAAERLEMNQPSLSTALSGRKITKRFALLLASAFPFNVDYLTTGEGQLLSPRAAGDGYFAPVKEPGELTEPAKIDAPAPASLIERIMAALEDATKTVLSLTQENRDLRAYIRKLEREAKAAPSAEGLERLNGMVANDSQAEEYTPVSELIERVGK